MGGTAISECVDPAGVAIYWRWYYTNDARYVDDYDYSTPEKIGATGSYSKNWTSFDQTYNTVPDRSTVEWRSGKKRQQQTAWCTKFRQHVQSYLREEEEDNDTDTPPTDDDPDTKK